MALVGKIVNAPMGPPDLFAEELGILGTFRADYMVGNSKHGEYLLIEMEPAEDVAFKKNGKKSRREWGARLEHGFSQIVDWLWLMSTLLPSQQVVKSMFPNLQRFTGLLLIGRRDDMSEEELARLKWRSLKTKIADSAVLIFTYDDLISFIEEELEYIKSAHSIGATVPGGTTRQ